MMQDSLLIFALAVGIVLVDGCSKSPPPAILGVWTTPEGGTVEITRDKWIAKTDAGQTTFTYRVTKTRGVVVDVALVDDATGHKGTATVTIEHAALKISRADGQWVAWTRRL